LGSQNKTKFRSAFVLLRRQVSLLRLSSSAAFVLRLEPLPTPRLPSAPTNLHGTPETTHLEMIEAESSTLFVADIPYNIQESEFVTIFQDQPEFITARLRVDKNQNRVGFVDFETASSAGMARDRFQGHKFNDNHEGLNIHFSKPQGPKPKRRTNPEPRSAPAAAHSSPAYAAQSSPMAPQLVYPPGAEGGMPPPVYAYPHAAAQPSYGQHPYQYASMPSMFAPPLPADSTSCLYVEGLPGDATEREVSHIFRPFAGFSSLRILTKESKGTPSRTFLLCFAEYDNKYQATVAMNALQGYRMDKNDSKGLHISYAKSDRRERRRGGGGGSAASGGSGSGSGAGPDSGGGAGTGRLDLSSDLNGQ